jgi:glycogen debranching enzyme
MAPDLFSGWGIRTLSNQMTAFSPISYHNGTVWPHDNGLIIAGLHRYGHNDEARRAIDALLETTRWFSMYRLPELFCGYDRLLTPFPVDYPVACSPQAWAAGCIIQLIQVMLGLRQSEDGLVAIPISDRVTSIGGVHYRGEWFDVEGGIVSRAEPAGVSS